MTTKLKIIYATIFLIAIVIILFLYFKNQKIVAFDACLNDCLHSVEGAVCLQKCQSRHQMDWGEYIFWKDWKSKLHLK